MKFAARLKASPRRIPETILPCSYAGTMGMVQYSSMDRRFFHKLGASLLDRDTLLLERGQVRPQGDRSASARSAMDPERFDESKLIGAVGRETRSFPTCNLWSRVQEAKRRGAKSDRHRSLTAACLRRSAEPSTSPCSPGTDGALALGMMHVLIAEGCSTATTSPAERRLEPLAQRGQALHARVGGANLRNYARGTWLQRAREYGSIRPAAIRLNYGMQRHAGGRHCGAHHCLLARRWSAPGATRRAASSQHGRFLTLRSRCPRARRPARRKAGHASSTQSRSATR